MTTGNILFLALVLGTFFSFMGVVGFVSRDRPRPAAKADPAAPSAQPARG